MGQGKKEEAMAMKEQVNADAKRLSELEAQEEELQARILKNHDDHPEHYRSFCSNR